MSTKYIDIMDTTYSKGCTTLLNSTVATKDYLPAVEFASSIGIDHFEFSTIDTFLSYISNSKENPFKIMQDFRDAVGAEANLQIFAHSLGGFSYNVLSQEMIYLFSKLIAKYGTTTTRIYDSLNDMRNLEYVSNAFANENMMSEVSIILHSVPLSVDNFFNVNFYKEKIMDMLDNGVLFDSIVFIDPVGSVNPVFIYEVIDMTRELLGEDVHIRLSVVDSLATGISSYLAGLEAGVDGIDLSVSPLSGGASSPDMLAMLNVVKNMGYNLGDLEIKKIFEYQKFLANQLKNYTIENQLAKINSNLLNVPLEPKEVYKICNDIDNNFLYNIIDELLDITQKCGYAISINPLSKIVLEQAVLNIEYTKWKKITDDFAKLILGYLGQTPIVADPDLTDDIIKDKNLKINLSLPLDLATDNSKKSIEYYQNILNRKNIKITDENIYIEASSI